MKGEELPKHNLGPIQDGETEMIWDGVVKLYDNLAYLEEYPLPEPPSNLKCRFWLARNELGDIDPEFQQLPDELFPRAHCGNIYALNIAGHVASHMNDDQRGTTTTPDDLKELYYQTKAEQNLIKDEFDLHDAYVCTQAWFIQAYERWQREGGWYEYTELPTLSASLDVIGQAISEEMAHNTSDS